MAAHSMILVCKILWTKEPGGLQSIGLQRVRHKCEVTWHSLTHGGSSFSFLRNLHIVFYSSYSNLHSYLQHTKVLFLLHPYQQFVFCDLFDDSHSGKCEVLSHSCFVCISQISSADHLSCACWLPIGFVWKNVSPGLRPIFFKLSCLHFWWVIWAAYVFWILAFYQSHCFQVFSPIQEVVI